MEPHLGPHHGPKFPQKLFTTGLPGINGIVCEVLSATALEQYCMVSHEFLNFSRLWLSTV